MGTYIRATRSTATARVRPSRRPTLLLAFAVLALIALAYPLAAAAQGAELFKQQGPNLHLPGLPGNASDVSVALSADGNMALVGDPHLNEGAGGVWVFVRNGETFEAREQLTGKGEEKGSGGFGASVAIAANGRIALVGAPGDQASGLTGAGAAYVFERTEAGTWNRLGHRLTGAKGERTAGAFGSAVALSGDGGTLLVGARFDEAYSSASGSAFAFTRTGNETWTQLGARLTGDEREPEVGSGEFGTSVAISEDGTSAMIGAPAEECDDGAAYPFELSGGTFKQLHEKLHEVIGCLSSSRRAAVFNAEHEFTAEEELAGRFGEAVAISGDGGTALVGAPHDEGFNGSGFVFVRVGTNWERQSKKLLGNTFEFEELGTSVALSRDGNTALAGAPQEEEHGAGFIFSRSGSSWQETQKLDAPSFELLGMGASAALDADGDTALLGMRNRELKEEEGEGGAAHLFTRGGAASAVTGPASALTQSGATVSATVEPHGDLPTGCVFEYGTTTAYGSTSACTPASLIGTSPSAASAALTGLAPNTTYHYRVSVANRANGRTRANGADATFTTFASSGSGTAPPGETAVARDGGLSAIASGGVGTVTVAVYGPGGGGPGLPGSTGRYIDVYRTAGSTFSKIEFTDCEIGAAKRIWWFDPASGWHEVSNQSYSPGPPACITVVITGATSPSLAQLTGTRFSFTIPEPGPSGTAASKASTTPQPRAFVSVSTSIKGAKLTLSVPNKCVRNGLVVATMKLTIPAHKRKGRVVVKIYKVVFTIAGQRKVERRKHLTNAPFKLKIVIKHPHRSTRYTLTGRAFIAVTHGPKRTKSLRVSVTTCP
jgi:hypothetical protein